MSKAEPVRPRADCYWCGGNYAIRVDGGLRRHRNPDAPPGSGFWCEGSERVPGGPGKLITTPRVESA